MSVGEVLTLTPMDIEDRKVVIRGPKSGREAQAVFLPHKIADRLRRYISYAKAIRWIHHLHGYCDKWPFRFDLGSAISTKSRYYETPI